jgi:hypothetical protein
VRRHAFRTPIDISGKQALCLSTTDYFDEFEPGNVKPAVCTENLNPDVVMVKSTEYRV